MAAVAGRQFGRIRRDQILSAGVSARTLGRWVADGYLHPELPRVYAVGHTAASSEARLSAALLYAGPGSMLSHETGVWWWGLLKYMPALIQISTPRRYKSRPGIKVHGRRSVDRVDHNGLPVTTLAQTLQDYALHAPKERLRFVLANVDYNGWLDIATLEALHGPGAVKLHAALKIHRPELAHTRSEFERLLLPACEAHDIPIPSFNVYINGWLVDAVWYEQKLVVELDSITGHRTPGQLQSNHQRDLELRAAGYVVLRYTWRQLTEALDQVIRDIRRQLRRS